MGRKSCPGCAALRRRVAELEATIRDLSARLGQNASNSSVPPSANPPAAPKPVVKKPTGRPSGGQPGHEPHLRQRLAAERVRAGAPGTHLPDGVRGHAPALAAGAGARDVKDVLRDKRAMGSPAFLPSVLAIAGSYGYTCGWD